MTFAFSFYGKELGWESELRAKLQNWLQRGGGKKIRVSEDGASGPRIFKFLWLVDVGDWMFLLMVGPVGFEPTTKRL